MTKESNTQDYVITLEECGSVEVHVEVELENESNDSDVFSSGKIKLH